MNIKKRFTNSETVTNSLGKDSLFSGNRIEVREEGNSKYFWINGVKTNIKAVNEGEEDGIVDLSNTGLYELYPQSGEEQLIEVFQKNIDLLNSKINTIHKELTYWDLYKIATKVENPSELDAKYADLLPGQSLVISCKTFIQANETYHMGDVIVKDIDGGAIKIDAANSGIYYPSAFYRDYVQEGGQEVPIYTDASGSHFLNPDFTEEYTGSASVQTYGYYKVRYSFSSNEPENNINDPKQEYKYPLISPAASDSFIYGIYATASTSMTVGKQTYEGTVIEPLPKYFYIDDALNTSVQEEIDVHHKIKLIDSSFHINCEDLPSGIEVRIQVK